jgi:hypothetical protein
MSKLSAKKPTGTHKTEAQARIEGTAWHFCDPNAPPKKDEKGKYINTFLLRLNEWEQGALSEIAKANGRSAQQQAREILRSTLKKMISK